MLNVNSILRRNGFSEKKTYYPPKIQGWELLTKKGDNPFFNCFSHVQEIEYMKVCVENSYTGTSAWVSGGPSDLKGAQKMLLSWEEKDTSPDWDHHNGPWCEVHETFTFYASHVKSVFLTISGFNCGGTIEIKAFGGFVFCREVVV